MKPFLLLALSLAASLLPGRGSEVLPGEGFPADRYESLWKKPPFAVATPEQGTASPEYALVGIAEFDHVSYASLVDRHTREHFVVSTQAPARGVVLLSILHAHPPDRNSAALEIDGLSVVLPLETPAAPAPVAVAGASTPVPGPAVVPSMPSNQPPLVRLHRPIVHIPLPP
jgi:hypothetical protein